MEGKDLALSVDLFLYKKEVQEIPPTNKYMNCRPNACYYPSQSVSLNIDHIK